MRLSLCVLLATLALCCYEANARVCPSYISALRGFFLENAIVYNIRLQKYLPPRETVEAKLRVKQCTDRIPRKDRLNILNVAKDVVSICNS